MTIWIDNDGCPRETRELVLKQAEKRRIMTYVVGNSYMRLPISPLLRLEVVPSGPDAADDLIAERAEAGDLVITADIPLAARVVAKGAQALSPRGEVYDSASIGQRLAVRNLMHDLRATGEIIGGGSSMGTADRKRFADALDRQLAKMK